MLTNLLKNEKFVFNEQRFVNWFTTTHLSFLGVIELIESCPKNVIFLSILEMIHDERPSTKCVFVLSGI